MRPEELEERRLEEIMKEIASLFELPPKERMCTVDPKQIIKEYRLDRYGELLVWICRDDSGKKFVVLVYGPLPGFYRYEWHEKEEAWRIARQLQARMRMLNRLLG
jgi:hypothetical protein